MKRLPFLLIISLCFAGCAANRGTLVAAGGSMNDETGEVHERILRNTNRAIGIITTASINELEGFTSKRDGFAKWAPNREVIDIGLREDHPEKADDPSVVALIERCDVLFFIGGDQKRIVDVFRPRQNSAENSRRNSAAYEAVLRLLDRGGTVAGTSAGAAMMGDVMFHSGQIKQSVEYWTEQNSQQKFDVRAKFASTGLFAVPADGTLKLGTGMGLVHHVIIDSHFAQRKRIGRLEIALDITGQPWGIGVNENCAVIIDRASGQVESIGAANEVATLVRRDPAERWPLVGGSHFAIGEVPAIVPAK